MRCSLALSILLSAMAGYAVADDLPLKLERTIPLPGVRGRMDHLTLDASGARLWIAALANNTVEVVDLEAGKLVRSLPGSEEPQGICLLRDSNRIVVASGGDGMVRAYDESMNVVASVSGLDDADNVRDDAKANRVYVGYGEGAIAVLDAGDLEKVAEIPLGDHPESFQLEKNGPRIFVNVPGKQRVTVIDRERTTVVAHWPIIDAQANYPMALDEPRRRLYVACREPARLLAIDTESGKIVMTWDCCGDADDVFLDPVRHRLYVTGGDGSISTFELTDTDQLTPLAAVQTRDGARTSLLDPKSGCLFVAVPCRGAHQAEVRILRPQP